MHPDKWPEIKEKILGNFEVLSQTTEKDEERLEETEIIEFNGPEGKVRLEWITRPKVLDKKTHYSNRIGGDIQVDYVYSKEEQTHTLKVFKEDTRGNWQEINADSYV